MKYYRLADGLWAKEEDVEKLIRENKKLITIIHGNGGRYGG